MFSSDDCSEHFNYGIQEAGDAVTFPSNSAVKSAETSDQSNGLSVPKPVMSFKSENPSMVTPKAFQRDTTDLTGLETLKRAPSSDLDKAAEDSRALNPVLSEDIAPLPRHHSSDATQYSTDSESSRLGSCST